MLRIDGMEKGMVVKYQKLGFLQTKGKKTAWKVPAVYSKIDDKLKKQPMGRRIFCSFSPRFIIGNMTK